MAKPGWVFWVPLFKSKQGGLFSPNSLQFIIYNLYLAAEIEGASSHNGRRTFERD